MCSYKCSPYVVDNTVGHALSLDWQVNRWCMGTASNAKDIKCVRRGMTGLVNRLQWLDTLTAALLYGCGRDMNLMLFHITNINI